MHVSIIANNFQEDYIIDLVNNLSTRVDRLDLIGSGIYLNRSLDRNIKFYNYRSTGLENGILLKAWHILRYYISLVRYLFASRAEVVHVQWIRFSVIEGIILTLIIRLARKKAVYTAHDVLPHSKDNALQRLIFKIIYRLQDDIVVHTTFIKKRIQTEFKVQESRIHVVKHGVYLKTPNPSITRESAREKIGLDSTSIVYLFFGFITRYKGLDLLIQAFRDIVASGHAVELVVAGRVKDDYEKDFQEITKKDNTVKEKLITRYIDDDELEYLFKSADVTVLPYREASQSGVLFMSYCFGVPVIAPKLGGFPDDVVPGLTGYLFKPGSLEDLREVMLDYQENPITLQTGSTERVRNYALENYSWQKTCDDLVVIYGK